MFGSEPLPFDKLARIAGLDPACDFRNADLRDADLRGADLTAFDFRDALFSGARVGGTRFGPSIREDQIRSMRQAQSVTCFFVGQEAHDEASGVVERLGPVFRHGTATHRYLEDARAERAPVVRRPTTWGNSVGLFPLEEHTARAVREDLAMSRAAMVFCDLRNAFDITAVLQLVQTFKSQPLPYVVFLTTRRKVTAWTEAGLTEVFREAGQNIFAATVGSPVGGDLRALHSKTKTNSRIQLRQVFEFLFATIDSRPGKSPVPDGPKPAKRRSRARPPNFDSALPIFLFADDMLMRQQRLWPLTQDWLPDMKRHIREDARSLVVLGDRVYGLQSVEDLFRTLPPIAIETRVSSDRDPGTSFHYLVAGRDCGLWAILDPLLASSNVAATGSSST